MGALLHTKVLYRELCFRAFAPGAEVAKGPFAMTRALRFLALAITAACSGYTSELPSDAIAGGDQPIPVPPLAPSDLAASPVSAFEIELTWTDNSTDEEKFKVERSLTE